jgi:hypothetical protein
MKGHPSDRADACVWALMAMMMLKPKARCGSVCSSLARNMEQRGGDEPEAGQDYCENPAAWICAEDTGE